MSEIAEMYQKALKERDEIIAKIEPLRKKEAELEKKIAPLEAQLREVREQIAELEKPRLAEVSRTIAALAPSQHRLMAEGGSIGVSTE